MLTVEIMSWNTTIMICSFAIGVAGIVGGFAVWKKGQDDAKDTAAIIENSKESILRLKNVETQNENLKGQNDSLTTSVDVAKEDIIRMSATLSNINEALARENKYFDANSRTIKTVNNYHDALQKGWVM